MKTWAVVVAAGKGTRLASAGAPDKKQFLPLRGEPLYRHGARTLVETVGVDGVAFVFSPEDVERGRADVEAMIAGPGPRFPFEIAAGGARRQDSVNNGLDALPKDCTHVLVHDAARPFATAAMIKRVLDALAEGAKAVIPGIAVTDTIKTVQGNVVTGTPDRSSLSAVQTPQGFELNALRQAHKQAEEQGLDVTDDAAMMEAAGHSVIIVEGEEKNVKITTPKDLALIEGESPRIPVTGWGYDVHKYGPGRPMKLGGVPILGAPEVVAHSDGDVLLHALMDALLGCLGKGDIGTHFPDSDAAYDNIESGVLLAEVLSLAEESGLTIHHADITIIAQTPKLSPWRDQITSNLASLLKLPPQRVNVKATTEEGLGFTGRKEGIKAVAVVSGMMQPIP